MTRWPPFFFSVICYALFNAVFLYLAAFLLEVGVAKTINSGEVGHWAPSLAINLGLIGLFGATHSLMARDWFKRLLIRIAPQVVERSIYVLQSSIFLAIAMLHWRAMPQVIWHVDGVGAWLFYAAFALGTFLLLWSTFLIDHFELFGVRQTWAHLRGEPMPEPEFRTPALYRIVRHPMQLGVAIMFLATPHMTVGHLLFAGAMIAYILVGLYFEERALVRLFGDQYRAYQARVPMLIPGLRAPRPAAASRVG